MKNYVITNLPEGFFFVFPPNILKPARQIKSYFPHLSCCFIEIEKFDIFTLFVSDKEIFLSLPKLSCAAQFIQLKIESARQFKNCYLCAASNVGPQCLYLLMADIF